MKLSTKILQSYARHLVGWATAIIFAVVNLNHISITHFSTGDWKLVANALWAAAIFQLRFAVLPAAKRYITKKYPQFAWVFSDAATAVDTRLTEITPTQVEPVTPATPAPSVMTGVTLPVGGTVTAVTSTVPVEVTPSI